VHLLGELGGVAEGFEVRELLMNFRHGARTIMPDSP
jgi:hypothetical protein